jgi:hypothetical protein
VALLLSSAATAADKELYWGDTHLHTSYSFDAFLNNNLSADPDTAYRWAKGLPVIHPYNRARVRIGTPLDFLVVSDHAEFLGSIRDIYLNGITQADAGVVDNIRHWFVARTLRQAIDARQGADLFADVLPVSENPREAAARWSQNPRPDASDNIVSTTWGKLAAAADRHDNPGVFTAFAGWEWSSTPGGANLHRVVITTADEDLARTFVPFSSVDSPYPEDLWRWLEATARATGASFTAIPHNSNISKGFMFAATTLRGEPISAEYALLRSRWERVAEVTQIKGDSETHPELSPADEFADFETFPYYLQKKPEPYRVARGDYLRAALGAGLEFEATLGVNPFRLGLIGSTDSHTGLASAEEGNFWGKMATDSVPENKQSFSLAGGPSGWTMAAQGLAAVWAQENTREAIMQAFVRREVYATTGTRIRLLFFAGPNYVAEDLASPDLHRAGQTKGVPMGGEIEGADTLSFLIAAEKDPLGANLDRIQVVKGWLDAQGRFREAVFNVAWSGARAPAADNQLPAVGSTVDLATGRYANTIGARELNTVWTDPTFDPAVPAFYYVRVLEIPTPRHAFLDALALGLEAPTEGPATLQERAYSSPIWYRPQELDR